MKLWFKTYEPNDKQKKKQRLGNLACILSNQTNKLIQQTNPTYMFALIQKQGQNSKKFEN